MKRYQMTRFEREEDPIVVVVIDGFGGFEARLLEHLAHKSKAGFEWGDGELARDLWTHNMGVSDLARSIVGDVLGDRAPAPRTYRAITDHLKRIPHEGGEITEEEVRALIGQPSS